MRRGLTREEKGRAAGTNREDRKIILKKKNGVGGDISEKCPGSAEKKETEDGV